MSDGVAELAQLFKLSLEFKFLGQEGGPAHPLPGATGGAIGRRLERRRKRDHRTTRDVGGNIVQGQSRRGCGGIPALKASSPPRCQCSGDQTVFGMPVNGRMPNQGMNKSGPGEGEPLLGAALFRILIFLKTLQGQKRVSIVDNSPLSIIPPAVGFTDKVGTFSIGPRFKEPQFVEFRILQ